MQNHNALLKALVVVFGLSFFCCANTNAPTRWLAYPDDVPSDVYGSWISVESDSGNVGGELIAICDDSVFVADSTLHSISVREIRSARLVVFQPEGWIAASVLLGTLSTISNGWYLVFTAPMWLIGGTIAAAARSYDPIMDYPRTSMEKLVPFARYPQGISFGLNRDRIRVKARRE